MDRRLVILSGIAAAAAKPALAQSAYDGAPPAPPPPPDDGHPSSGAAPPSDPNGRYTDQDREDYGPLNRGAPDSQPNGQPDNQPAQPYEKHEIVNAVSDFLGVTAEAAGSAIEKIFHENGRPTAYIAGTEGSGAFVFGLRYGDGLMYMKNRDRMKVYWQGPTGGFDFGANVGRVFTLCYTLQYPDAIYRRFPGVDGSAYFIGGLGINYQRADGITLAPIRVGLGLRLGASVGYLAYSRRRNLIPL
jgi:hypothetical protein